MSSRDIIAVGEKNVGYKEYIVHVTKMFLKTWFWVFLTKCVHVLVGFVRASPYTQFTLPTSGPLKCLATCVKISLTAGHHQPPPAPMNLCVPQNALTDAPSQHIGDLLLHHWFSFSRVVVSWVMMNVLLYAMYAMTTPKYHQNTVLFIHIVGQYTLSMKTLCWHRLCQLWMSKCYFTTPVGEVVA